MANMINWFEIPVEDFDRAKKFYSEVLGGNIQEMDMMGTKMGFLDNSNEGVGGAICKGEDYTPAQKGVKIYLNGGDDLNTPLSKVEQAGGKVTMPKTKINDEIGYMAFFEDTEGNALAFHSPK